MKTDAWEVADPTLCDVCGLEGCVDHIPVSASEAETAARRARRVAAFFEEERARREARRLLQAEDRARVPAPELLTLRERLARGRPALRWRIHGWQPCEARVMLAAAQKAGKTTLIGSLIRSLVDTEPWLDRDPVAPLSGSLALVDTEMGPRQLEVWLAKQQIRGDERVLVLPMRGSCSTFDLVDPQTKSEWAARLRAHRVAYLILDCLRPVLDALGLDENREAGRFLVAFDALLAEAQISEALVVHHMGHNGERSRGDSRLRDWPDVEWRIVRQDEAPTSARYLVAYGRDVEQPEAQLAYDAATRRLTLAGGTRRDAKLEAALEAVLEALAREPLPMSGRDVKEALSGLQARDTIDAALRLGVTRGRLSVESGARRAKLYRRVSECPAVSD